MFHKEMKKINFAKGVKQRVRSKGKGGHQVCPHVRGSDEEATTERISRVKIHDEVL